jgi:serralysin
VFDALSYIASYGDLIAAFGADALAGARHYINWGFGEGRQVLFDPAAYLERFPDVQRVFGNDAAAAARHFIVWGFQEGRRPAIR